jgi:hypothetical protein
MKTTLALVALCLAATPRAWAASEMYRLYDVDPHGLDPKAVKAIRDVVGSCAVSEMSRMGPSPQQVAACNATVASAVALGPPAVLAALARLDEGTISGRAVGALYDIVRRSGDIELIEPLVRALEREDPHGIGNPRQYERTFIVEALGWITYTELKGTPAIQWRTWATAHPHPSRSVLLAERLAQVEAQIASGKLEDIVEAARFLGTQAGGAIRARRLLDELEAHPPLTHEQITLIRQARWRLPDPPVAPTQPAQPHPQAALLPRS